MRLFFDNNMFLPSMSSDSSCSNSDSSSYCDDDSILVQALSTLVTQEGEGLADILKQISLQIDRQNKILIKIGRILGEE